MALRPAVIPETFTGDGEWMQWIYHFENMVAVNEWNEAKKLFWLRPDLPEELNLLCNISQKRHREAIRM